MSRIDTCSNCFYEDIPTKAYRTIDDRGVRLCRVCANTFAGMVTIQPDGISPGEQKLLKTMAWIGNEILATLRPQEEQPNEVGQDVPGAGEPAEGKAKQ